MSRFFTGNETLEELKNKYRNLCKKHHPDLGGNEESMKQLNNEYDEIFERAKHNNNIDDNNRKCYEKPEQTREFIEKLLKIEKIEIEICGSWCYISGKTYESKEILKELNCRYSKTKKVWYWFPGIEKDDKKYRGRKTLNQIRKEYGSEKIITNEKIKIGV